MTNRRQVNLMLTIPEEIRNRLRIMAAQKNLKNPSRVTSASTIAKEIVCESLQKSVSKPGGKNDGNVTAEIFNTAGQKVATPVSGFLEAGKHSVVWDAGAFPAGVYFCKVTNGHYSDTVKMTLVK